MFGNTFVHSGSSLQIWVKSIKHRNKWMYSKLISWRNVVQGIIRPAIVLLRFSLSTPSSKSCTLHQVEQLFACFSISSKFSRMPETNCRSELYRFVHVVNEICVLCRALLTLWNCLSNAVHRWSMNTNSNSSVFCKRSWACRLVSPFSVSSLWMWLSASTMWEVSLMVTVYKQRRYSSDTWSKCFKFVDLFR